MHSQRFSLGVAGVLAACFFALPAHANKNGITGYSGKQGAAQTCMTAGCHGTNPSGVAPTVTLTGPTSIAAGATGNYTLVITGGAATAGGMNVAVSTGGGTLSNAGADVKVQAQELTHTAPKAFTANEVRFDFSLVAPASARTVTLYASGNSTNDSNTSDGDRSASTTLDVQITGGTSSPDAGTGDPDPDPIDEDDGGCSAVGGAPMVLLLAVVAARMRRRSS